MAKPGRKPKSTVSDIDQQIEALKTRRDELIMAEGRKVVDAARATGLLDLKLPDDTLVKAFGELVARFQTPQGRVAYNAGNPDKAATGHETRRVG
jgi:TraC-like protein